MAMAMKGAAHRISIEADEGYAKPPEQLFIIHYSSQSLYKMTVFLGATAREVALPVLDHPLRGAGGPGFGHRRKA
jgi:hypothetical protein